MLNGAANTEGHDIWEQQQRAAAITRTLQVRMCVTRAGTYAIRIYTRPPIIAASVIRLWCGVCVMGNSNAQLMALCMACGRKATLSVYSRILGAELTICKGCALKNKGAANE